MRTIGADSRSLPRAKHRTSSQKTGAARRPRPCNEYTTHHKIFTSLRATQRRESKTRRAIPVRVGILHENLLRDLGMNTERPIDDLSDMIVDCRAGQRVGRKEIESLLLLQKFERPDHREPHRFVQIRIESVNNIVS